MKNCKQCDECLANSICANWVTPIAKVCSIFLEAVDALKTARNRQSTPCPAYRKGGVCKEFGGFSNCGDSPCE